MPCQRPALSRHLPEGYDPLAGFPLLEPPVDSDRGLDNRRGQQPHGVGHDLIKLCRCGHGGFAGQLIAVNAGSPVGSINSTFRRTEPFKAPAERSVRLCIWGVTSLLSGFLRPHGCLTTREAAQLHIGCQSSELLIDLGIPPP